MYASSCIRKFNGKNNEGEVVMKKIIVGISAIVFLVALVGCGILSVDEYTTGSSVPIIDVSETDNIGRELTQLTPPDTPPDDMTLPEVAIINNDDTSDATENESDAHATEQDIPLHHHLVTVSASDLPEGFAGFSFILHEMYTLAAWAPNDGFFLVPDNDGHWYMSIAQLTDYTSADEWVYSMIESANIESQILAGVDVNRTYEPPTSTFSFFAMERHLASEDGHLMQRFARDNGKGGMFLISIFLTPDEWDNGHGSRLLQSLESFEVLGV
jgi:hypothetical protein